MPRPLTDDWKLWLKTNLERGVPEEKLFVQAAKQDFDTNELSAALGGYRPKPAAAKESPPVGAESLWQALFNAPLTRQENQPRAWRIDTPLAQVYEIPDLLSSAECDNLMQVIDGSLKPSTVTRGPVDYRTSHTCHMRRANQDFVQELDRRLADLIGVDLAYSEPIQGQRYEEGQYFKAHTDWFAPGTDEYEKHTSPGGQRTWTVMIYLNNVIEGGETRFERIGRAFRPTLGMALAWNNLNLDGTPNHFTLHEALPVLKGRKYVITKWFREATGRNNPL